MDVLTPFEDFLKSHPYNIKSFHPFFNDALNYMLQSGGKHFRAQLLLSVVKVLKPDSFDEALNVALAIEMMHTYSLIHDDLPAMDNADFRRGIPTIHKKYDETTAILVGDALNTDSFGMIAKAKLDDKIKLKCIEILSFNSGSNGMVLGQAIDCYFAKQSLDFDQLKFLHLHKTGALIAASLQMGGVIAQMDESRCDHIYEIGLKLGLAFQIKDDIDDATKDESDIKKPVNADIDKNSFVNLLGVEESKLRKNNLIDEILGDLQSFELSLQQIILDLINRYLKDPDEVKEVKKDENADEKEIIKDEKSSLKSVEEKDTKDA